MSAFKRTREDLKRTSIIIIIIMIMDGSCIAQISPSRKLNALAHTIHANIQTDINIIYAPPPHTHTHIMVRLDLWKCLLKKESFELGFEVREGGKIPRSRTISTDMGGRRGRGGGDPPSAVFQSFYGMVC